MGRQCINDEDLKATKKALKKFSKKDITLFNKKLRGSFNIVGFRKYEFNDEVDIEFNGELFAVYYSSTGPTWFKSDIYNEKGVSKVKVNKLIKRLIFNEVKDHAAYFGIKLRYTGEIKKIKWV
jgi:hypothetical protein